MTKNAPCKTCRFWHNHERHLGECHIRSEFDDWPSRNSSDWCGEHKTKEPPLLRDDLIRPALEHYEDTANWGGTSLEVYLGPCGPQVARDALKEAARD